MALSIVFFQLSFLSFKEAELTHMAVQNLQ